MEKNKQLLLLLFTMLFLNKLKANEFLSVQALIERRMTFLKGKVEFEKILNTTKDTANYRSKGQTLLIRASNKSAAIYALNDYFKKYCALSFSETGDNLPPLKSLPQVKQPVGLSAFFTIRYALNYCTYNYTMSFWKLLVKVFKYYF